MLPPLPRGATPYPTIHTIGLSEFEARIANEPDEIAAAFDGEGRLVLAPRRGTPARVEFFESESERLQGAVVTHVHPLGGPFSGADATLASDNDVAELRIVLRGGLLYRLLRPDGGWPDRQAMREAAESPFERRAEWARMPNDEYERKAFHAQRNAFARIGVSMTKGSWW